MHINQDSNLSELGMKTRPWKFAGLAHNALFKLMILRGKTVLLGTLNNMQK